LEFAAEASAPPTDLYRLYEFDDRTANPAVARDIRSAAHEIIDAVKQLRPSVTPGDYTVAVNRFGTC
jgi:hypothetical protein